MSGWSRQHKTTIAEQYDHFVSHFGKTDLESAYYMGCLRMMQICMTQPKADLCELAAELDRYLARDRACICEHCKDLQEAGLGYSLVEDLFASEAGHA
jgi:hypothetical protein